MFTYRERESGLRSVHILRASHTDARLRHSQPANSLIGGPRPPARITAGPKPRRRRRSRRLRPPSLPPELEPSPPSRPCSPLRGRGGGWEERQAHGLLTSPAALPDPERQGLQLRFPPGARTNAGGAFSLPNERRRGGPGGGRKGVYVLRGAAWTHNGGRFGETSYRGYWTLAAPRSACRTSGLSLP